MQVLPIHPEVEVFLKKRGLKKKFEKQKRLFEVSPFYPSLETDLLEPRQMKIWSFRLDRKYRVIFIFRNKETIEIIDINNHYQ